ncbi:hypothetical protein GX48_06178 [Paracoccidioides brasiliensis]|nr:hypothetical protein GX48_06178 [Paracoccidioides brasiliensis]
MVWSASKDGSELDDSQFLRDFPITEEKTIGNRVLECSSLMKVKYKPSGWCEEHTPVELVRREGRGYLCLVCEFSVEVEVESLRTSREVEVSSLKAERMMSSMRLRVLTHVD